MQTHVIVLCARGWAKERWLLALETMPPSFRVVTTGDEAALLTCAGTDSVDTVILDCDHAVRASDALLEQVRESFPTAKFVLSARRRAAGEIGTGRTPGVDAFVPHEYTDRQRRLALELVLTGAGTFPAEAHAVPERYRSDPPAEPLTADAGGASHDDGYGLTPREKTVAVGLARGEENHEIALDLGLAPGVVRNHVSSILRKLGKENRTQAALFLVRLSWIRERVEQDARSGHGVLDRLRPHFEPAEFRSGTVIFRKGEPGRHLFYIRRGRIGLDEIDAEMGPGEIFGEIGAFAPGHLRTCTTRARTDVTLFRLHSDHVRRVFFESPEFAFFVVSVIAERISEERGL